MNLYRAAGCLLLLTPTVIPVFAQTNPCRTTQPVSTLGSPPVLKAPIVYDPNQKVCWLANADLAGDPNMRTALGVAGVNPNGSMDYATAQKWVAALNAYNNGTGYLDHNDWQLPTAPLVDSTCASTGPGWPPDPLRRAEPCLHSHRLRLQAATPRFCTPDWSRQACSSSM
jgi:hypothetical protein